MSCGPRLEAVQALVRMREDVPLDIDAVLQEPSVPTIVENFMEGDEMEDGEAEALQITSLLQNHQALRKAAPFCRTSVGTG